MIACAIERAAPDLSISSPKIAPPKKMKMFFWTKLARPVTYEFSVPTIALAMFILFVKAMMMAVTIEVTRTFHPFIAATTKNTRPTMMPSTPTISM